MNDTTGGSVWERVERGSRGPQRAHTVSEIAESAVAIADAEGLGGVSMRALAAAIGASAPGLYRYLSRRSDLLDLMVDHVTAEIEWPPGDDGGDDEHESLIELASAMRAVHQRHPWMREALSAPRAFGPHSTRLIEAYLVRLSDVDAPTTHKMELFAVITAIAGLAFDGQRPTGDPFPLAGSQLTPSLVNALDSEASSPRDPSRVFTLTVSGVIRSLL